MKAMEYRGYHAAIEFDGEDGILVGRLLGINDVVGFHAESVGEMRAAFRAADRPFHRLCVQLIFGDLQTERIGIDVDDGEIVGLVEIVEAQPQASLWTIRRTETIMIAMIIMGSVR